MSRMDIIRAVADTDGGSHIDPGFTQLYHSFRTGEFSGWLVNIEGKENALIASPLFACVGAIAHELLLSLKEYAPWCFEEPYQSAAGS